MNECMSKKIITKMKEKTVLSRDAHLRQLPLNQKPCLIRINQKEFHYFFTTLYGSCMTNFMK